jgi:hypothetical protein
MITDANHGKRCLGRYLLVGYACACLALLGAPALAQSPEILWPEKLPRDDWKDKEAQHSGVLGLPMWFSTRLYLNRPNCVRAKLDIWLDRGRYTSSIFIAGASQSDPDLSRIDASNTTMNAQQTLDRDPSAKVANVKVNEDGKTTMILGLEGCRYRIQIDKAD